MDSIAMRLSRSPRCQPRMLYEMNLQRGETVPRKEKTKQTPQLPCNPCGQIILVHVYVLRDQHPENSRDCNRMGLANQFCMRMDNW